jgi:type IV pilus assembly protein PilF
MFGSVRLHWIRALTVLALVGGLGCVTTDSHEPVKPDPAAVARKQAEARYNMGIDHLKRGRTALAVRELQASLALEESDAWTHFAIAEAYRRSGRTDESIQHLKRSIELKPQFHSARLNISGVYIQRGEFEEAAAECQFLLDDPTFGAPWRALTNLGWAQFRMGETESARQNLRMASQYNERYWPALLNLGILEAEAGRRLEALTLFQQVLELNSGPLAGAEAHFRSAEIFIAIGQQEKAVPHLVAATEAKPSGKWGNKSEEYLKLLR